MKNRAPLVFGPEIDEVLGIEEAGSVRAVIGTPCLADDLLDLGKGSHDQARTIHYVEAGRGSAGGCKGAARPDGALIEMGQELGADHAGGDQKRAKNQRPGGTAHRHAGPVDVPDHQRPVAPRDPVQHRIFPLGGAVAEQKAGQRGGHKHGEN